MTDQPSPPSGERPQRPPAPPQPPPAPAPPPSAYQPAPGAGYPQPQGWVPGVPTSDERTWAMLAHIGPFLLGFLAPLIIMLTKGKESPYVRDQSVEALNFTLTVLIASIVSVILIFVIVGIFTLMAVAIGALVLHIMAGVAAYNGRPYRYPVNLRMVK